MDKSSSQALVICSPCVLECREANLYTVTIHTVITLEASQSFRRSIARKSASLQFTNIHLLTWLARILSIDGATIQILNIREVVTR